MKSIRVRAIIDERHRLTAEAPPSVPPGKVDVLILPRQEEDEAGNRWIEGIAREWAAELDDPREDIYTLADGEPVDGAR